MDVLTKKDKKYIVKIEGNQYELSPVNWNVLSGIEEETGAGFIDSVNSMQTTVYKSTLTLAWVFLRDKYPELTKEAIGKVTDHAEILSIRATILDAMLDYYGVNNG
jgi:hypothetical protein